MNNAEHLRPIDSTHVAPLAVEQKEQGGPDTLSAAPDKHLERAEAWDEVFKKCLTDPRFQEMEGDWTGLQHVLAYMAELQRKSSAAPKKEETQRWQRIMLQLAKNSQDRIRDHTLEMEAIDLASLSAAPEKQTGFTAEEYTPEIKRRKMQGVEVELERCENCGEKSWMPWGECRQCGHGAKIGCDSIAAAPDEEQAQPIQINDPALAKAAPPVTHASDEENLRWIAEKWAGKYFEADCKGEDWHFFLAAIKEALGVKK